MMRAGGRQVVTASQLQQSEQQREHQRSSSSSQQPTNASSQPQRSRSTPKPRSQYYHPSQQHYNNTPEQQQFPVKFQTLRDSFSDTGSVKSSPILTATNSKEGREPSVKPSKQKGSSVREGTSKKQDNKHLMAKKAIDGKISLCVRAFMCCAVVSAKF
jgi:hypothetical protein